VNGKSDTWEEEEARVSYEEGISTDESEGTRKYFEDVLYAMNERINLREENKKKVREKERL
jgi:hypothetical protein